MYLAKDSEKRSRGKDREENGVSCLRSMVKEKIPYFPSLFSWRCLIHIYLWCCCCLQGSSQAQDGASQSLGSRSLPQPHLPPLVRPLEPNTSLLQLWTHTRTHAHMHGTGENKVRALQNSECKNFQRKILIRIVHAVCWARVWTEMTRRGICGDAIQTNPIYCIVTQSSQISSVHHNQMSRTDHF